MSPSLMFAAILLFTSICARSLAAEYFRSDQGVVTNHIGQIPADLSLPQNLLWRRELDPGHSTPIIEDGRIFLTSGRSDNKELSTLALDAATGRLIWQVRLPVPAIEAYHPQEGSAAMASPASDGKHLFVFFGSHGVICYDLTGKQIWDHPMGPFRDEYGAASSPVVFRDRVILNEDHDIDSYVVALDSSTGRTIWKTPRPDAVRSYATPAVWKHNGTEELLIAGALELAGYDPADGKKLWWVNGLARIVIPSPLAVDGTIYMASWAPGGDASQRITLPAWSEALTLWDANKDGRLVRDEIKNRDVLDRFFRMDLDQSGGLDQHEWEHHAEVFRRAENALLALKPAGSGDLSQSALLWKYQRGVPYVSTPIVHNGIVWMVKDGGMVTKVNAATGQMMLMERLNAPGNYYASPLGDGSKVYFASEAGIVTVVADEPEWKIISAHDFKEKIHSSPLIRNGRLYIRTEKAIYCFTDPGKA
jgi:outer membrane protein assembly factor BamB